MDTNACAMNVESNGRVFSIFIFSKHISSSEVFASIEKVTVSRSDPRSDSRSDPRSDSRCIPLANRILGPVFYDII
jgi:hypothetical protein